MLATTMIVMMATPVAPPESLAAASAAVPDRLTDAAMRLRLAKHGFTEMKMFRKVGQSWRTTARRGNQRYAVQIDPDGLTLRMPID